MKKLGLARISNLLGLNRSKNVNRVAKRGAGCSQASPWSTFEATEPQPRILKRLRMREGLDIARMPLPAPASEPALGQVTLPGAAPSTCQLSARLDRFLPVPTLHLTDPALAQSLAIDPAVVEGLADGATVQLEPCATGLHGVTYQLHAPRAAFAHSMVGRVARGDDGFLWVEALQPNGPFCRLRLERGTDASVGDTVVASVENPQSRLARVVGQLQEAQSPLTAVCAIAADCGARFGHSAEAQGHAYNIQRDQRCTGPGLTKLPFFTLDPKGARVLDQAMHLERTPEQGYLLYYAIADGGALVPVDSAIDAEAAQRGAAVYLPASLPEAWNTALHLLPPALTQDAGSLLEQHNRPALVVRVKLDAECRVLDCMAERTVIHSLQQVSTQQLQWYYDHDMSSRLVAQPFAPSLALLREIGRKLVSRAKGRGASEVLQADTRAKPDLVATASGEMNTYEKHDQEVSQYNGQISMLVNEAVAAKLAQAGVRVPFLGDAETPKQDAQVHAEVAAMGLPWPAGLGTDDYLATLPPYDPRTVAIRRLILTQPPSTVFSPTPKRHTPLGLPAYVNVTAPLRRYQDMVTQRIMEAVFTGAAPVPYQSDASMAAVITAVNIGRERPKIIAQRTHGVRIAAYLRPHVGQSLPVRVVAVSHAATVVELEGCKIRLPVRLDPGATAPRVHDRGAVKVLAADVITRECSIAWLDVQATAA